MSRIYFDSEIMSKEPGREMLGKKAHYYVEYLGWRASKGLEGREFTEPIVRELVRRRHRGPLPKLTIQVSKKEIKVTRDVAEDSKKKKIKTIKYPAIPAKDVSFSVQALEPDTDIVACIYLGFNPRTSCYVHVHVYRCDSPTTAATFVHHMLQIVNIPEHKKRLKKIEQELLSKHEIEVPYSLERESFSVSLQPPPQGRFTMINGQGGHRMGSSAASTDSNESPPTGSDDLDADLYSLKEVMQFDAITDELKHRLKVTSAPLLLPPADYDTVSRARGNLVEANARKSRNPIIVGKGGPERQSEGSNGSADAPAPISDKGEGHQFPSEGFYVYPPRSPREDTTDQSSPRPNVFYGGSESPVVARHGRQHSSSSAHSHHSGGSGSHQSNGLHDSRDRLPERLSGYSNSSNSYRDLNVVDEWRMNSPRGHRGVYQGDVLLRPKDDFRRGPNLAKSMPADILRREIAAVSERDPVYRSSSPGYSLDRFSPAPSSPRSGDFGVRRVNSLYR